MVALVEFIVVGIVFVLLVKLSGTEKQSNPWRKSILRRANLKLIGQYWAFYLFSLSLVGLALYIAYPIKAWNFEIPALLLSAVMMFCGFFIFTATFLRMSDKMTH
jgi:DMSO reductase anchor subunit